MSKNAEGTLLFVCKGNICRSPFAERLYKLLDEGSDPNVVKSSGHYPVPDRTSPERAVRAAREFDVDLEAFRSSVLSKEQLRSADQVVVMDRQNYKACKKFGADQSKIFYLSRFHPNMKEGRPIEDPYGASYSTYVSCYKRICQAVKGLINVRNRSGSILNNQNADVDE